MPTVTSADGTTIAYDQAGAGPVIVFVPGAFNDRTTCAPLAEALQDRYTVITVDRRGRGASTDAIEPADVASYTVEREIQDLDAVLDAVGPATVFGFSSGGILALRAAAAGSAVARLVAYEPPFALGGLAGKDDDGLAQRLATLIASGNPDDAVATMQTDGIGLPKEVVAQIRQSPMWASLVAIAQTVVYDATITAAPGVPTPEMAEAPVETLVLCGSETWPGLREAAAALPAHLARARFVEVSGGANHTIPPAATAQAVHRFLTAAPAPAPTAPRTSR